MLFKEILEYLRDSFDWLEADLRMRINEKAGEIMIISKIKRQLEQK